MLSHPIPPQPELLCSIKHVFMCNECYHIPSHPNPNCCVASNMCSCATNVITSHPTPPKNMHLAMGSLTRPSAKTSTKLACWGALYAACQGWGTSSRSTRGSLEVNLINSVIQNPMLARALHTNHLYIYTILKFIECYKYLQQYVHKYVNMHVDKDRSM